MDNFSQGEGSFDMGQNSTSSMTLDELSELIRAAEPIVWSIAIVFGILGVTLTIRYLWRKGCVQNSEW